MSETYSRHLLQAEVAHRFNKVRCEITVRPKVPVITGKTVREITNVTCGCWYIDDACDAKCRQHRNQLNAIPRGNVLDRRASSQLSSAFSSSLLWSTYVAWTGEHICVYMCTRVCGRECIARTWPDARTTGWNYRAIVRAVTRHNSRISLSRSRYARIGKPVLFVVARDFCASLSFLLTFVGLK